MRSTLTLVACLALAGCALGSTRLGEQWTKEGASATERDAAIAQCAAEMRVQASHINPDGCPPFAVPGHTACLVASDVNSRKEFSRQCMQSMGWSLK
jgi:3,4-dihydroxy-2-butanone 4-phosphate synthase